MVASRGNGAGVRQRRRWFFAGCTFDEANWALLVRGRRVAIEGKPLELLRQLLVRGGDLVSKEELLDVVWPDVEVVEASLPTAIRKLRTALDDDRRKTPIIETVPRIGYRLAVAVEVEDMSGALASSLRAAPPSGPPAAAPVMDVQAVVAAAPPTAALGPRLLSISGGLALVLSAIAVTTTLSQNASASRSSPASDQHSAAVAEISQVHHREAVVAIRELNIEAIKRLLAAGWDPATPWDKQGNDALTMVINHCEWDPDHDRRQMLMMARTLIEGGAPVYRRNVWGDTAYSIAKAPRYCGPDHPITQMLEAMCYGGTMGPKDRCLATYELTAAQRKAQGLPPKA